MATRVTAIIQARMGSTRLPGKSMRMLSGKPVLWHVVQRVRAAQRVDDVVVATSTNPEDDVIEQSCSTWGFACYRGSSDNVLERSHSAAVASGAEVVVRITGDCPLIDPAIVDLVISGLGDNDYVTNVFDRQFPRGMDTEVMTFRALDRAQHEATTDFDREHVTPFLRVQEHGFKTANIAMPSAYHYPQFRLTLDTLEDYQLLIKIYNTFYRPGQLIDVPSVLRWLDEHPEIAALNADVQQKHDPTQQ